MAYYTPAMFMPHANPVVRAIQNAATQTPPAGQPTAGAPVNQSAAPLGGGTMASRGAAIAQANTVAATKPDYSGSIPTIDAATPWGRAITSIVHGGNPNTDQMAALKQRLGMNFGFKYDLPVYTTLQAGTRLVLRRGKRCR
jgi:hypothetical protein